MIKIHQANINDIEDLEVIFSLYLKFYKVESIRDDNITFLKERVQNNESVIFTAKKDDEIVGFTQLFPSFSSASLKKVYILNDLFVLENYRNQGIAKLLIHQVIEFAKENNCARVSLSTARNNPAQFLYEKLGFKESSFKFFNYNL
ncbi:GNAT family N-acetyltransferase [Sphingobacterium sp. MYb388]|uniref:GNAT family N-acetyltransferase n=1 Tax=Sphingobacterium sp. MYb388 TaxID=2745437 RepID=UPI0030B27BE2